MEKTHKWKANRPAGGAIKTPAIHHNNLSGWGAVPTVLHLILRIFQDHYKIRYFTERRESVVFKQEPSLKFVEDFFLKAFQASGRCRHNTRRFIH